MITDERLDDLLWNVDHAPGTAQLLASVAVLHPQHRRDLRWRVTSLRVSERAVSLN